MSMPQMKDPNFSGTLTYICEHNEQGAMGIVINRPADIGLSELLAQLDIDFTGNEQTVYAGGPVEQDRGFILHGSKLEAADLEEASEQLAWQSSLQITDEINLTTSKDILSAIADGSGPKDYVIALGYAGWGNGQLEQELAENTWLCCPANTEILFHQNNDKKMSLAMAIIGVDPSQLNGQIGHA